MNEMSDEIQVGQAPKKPTAAGQGNHGTLGCYQTACQRRTSGQLHGGTGESYTVGAIQQRSSWME